MENFFEDYENLGLPGGPNELKRFTNGFIISERGQWDYPGQPTAVPTPSGRITMEGVEDDLLGIDNLGNSQYMTPGNEYQFEGDMVYEIPQAKKGGSKKKPSKKYSRSLMAKNRLFAKNSLFKKTKSAKNKIFDPNSPYFQDGGVIVELDDNEIEEYRKGGYIVEDISVPSLNRMQDGGDNPPERTFTPIDPNYIAEHPDEARRIQNEGEVTVTREGSDIGKLRAEFREKNPMDIFLDEKKRQFLKKNKGLNKSAGVTMEKFPEDVLQNFMKEYEYKTNNYAVNKLGKKEGWNPKRRGEWVDELTPGEKDAVAESKYGSKLQPSYWSRSLAGLQELGNEAIKLLPGEQGDVMKFNIPGLTKKEQKEIRESKLGALETLAPMDMQGAWLANIAKNRGLSTGSDYKELPGILSTEKMPNVDDTDALALNLGTYAGLESIPELGINLARSLGKGALKLESFVKHLRDIEKTSKANSPNLTKMGFSLDMFNAPISSVAKSSKETPIFKSEIDWVDWVKKHNKNYDAEDIQNVIRNSEEYNLIEQQTKANGTWMKNADGSPFQGTPEQFIQQQSTKFKKAYPEGTEITYRGGDKRDALKSDWDSKSNVVFTTKDEIGARTYNRTLDQPPLSLTEAPQEGISQLYMPKTSNKIVIDGNEYSVGHPKRNYGYHRNYARLNAIDQLPANELEAKNLEAFRNWMLEKHPTMTERGFSGEPRILNDWVMTDHFADFLNSPAGRNIDRVEFQKIIDGTLQPIDVEVHNLNKAQQLKSMWGNSGEFDLTNPNKFKALLPYLIPTGLGVGAASQMQGQESNEEYKKGGIISKFTKKANGSVTAAYGHSVGNLIRKDEGGFITELDDKEIKKYLDGGYIVEELD